MAIKRARIGWNNYTVRKTFGGYPVGPTFNGTFSSWSFWDNSRTTTPDSVAGWQQKLRDGISATTTLDGTRYRVLRRQEGFYSWWNRSGPYMGATLQGYISTTTIPSTISLNAGLETTADTAAMISFAKNVRKNTQRWSAGVFVGELRQTATLLAAPGRVLRGSIDDIGRRMRELKHRSNVRTRRDFLKFMQEASSLHLTWAFGVKPLINDVNDAAEAFAETVGKYSRDFIPVGGYGEHSSHTKVISNGPVSLNTSGNNAVPYGTLDYVDKTEVRYYGQWKNENPSGTMPTNVTFGLDLSSFVPTVYNLVPYSFLVDYFLNLGDALDAWSMRFLEFAWINRTVRNSRTYRLHELVSPPWSVDTGRRAYGGQTCIQRVRTYRQPSSNNFAPKLAVRIPGFPDTKWVNVAALITARNELQRIPLRKG